MDVDRRTCAVQKIISADVIASLSHFKIRSRRNLRVRRYGKKEPCEDKAESNKHLHCVLIQNP